MGVCTTLWKQNRFQGPVDHPPPVHSVINGYISFPAWRRRCTAWRSPGYGEIGINFKTYSYFRSIAPFKTREI